MKKATTFIAALFFLSISFVANAQDGDNRRERTEEKLEFIVEQMDLEDEQREHFVELYREQAYSKIEQQRRNMERGSTDGDSRAMEMEKLEGISEEEAQELFMHKMELQEKEFQLNQDFQIRMMKAIGAKNMLKLQSLERDYHKKMRGDSGKE